MLKIGYFDNYLPYCDTLPSGKATGSMVDIMNGILSKVNLSDKIELEYKPYDDYSDLIKDLDSKKVDLIFPCSNESWFAEQNGMYLSRIVVDSGMNIAYLKNYNSSIFEKSQSTRTISFNINIRELIFWMQRLFCALLSMTA